jgi:hypothetical protein
MVSHSLKVVAALQFTEPLEKLLLFKMFVIYSKTVKFRGLEKNKPYCCKQLSAILSSLSVKNAQAYYS